MDHNHRRGQLLRDTATIQSWSTHQCDQDNPMIQSKHLVWRVHSTSISREETTCTSSLLCRLLTISSLINTRVCHNQILQSSRDAILFIQWQILFLHLRNMETTQGMIQPRRRTSLSAEGLRRLSQREDLLWMMSRIDFWLCRETSRNLRRNLEITKQRLDNTFPEHELKYIPS